MKQSFTQILRVPFTINTYTNEVVFRNQKKSQFFYREIFTRFIILTIAPCLQLVDLIINLLFALGKMPIAIFGYLSRSHHISHHSSLLMIYGHLVFAKKCFLGLVLFWLGVIFPRWYIAHICAKSSIKWKQCSQPLPLNHYFAQILYLNLEYRTDRASSIEQHFNLLGIQVKKFAATDGKAAQTSKNSIESALCEIGLKGWDIHNIERFGGRIKQEQKIGHFSCLLSHLRMIQQIKNEKQMCLLLEDDCRFTHSAPYLLPQAIKELNQLPYWDVFYLGGSICAPLESLTDCHYIKKAIGITETHAYALNPKNAEKIFNALIKHLKEDQKLLPIDQYLRNAASTGQLNCITIFPMIAEQELFFSDTNHRQVFSRGTNAI